MAAPTMSRTGKQPAAPDATAQTLALTTVLITAWQSSVSIFLTHVQFWCSGFSSNASDHGMQGGELLLSSEIKSS